MRAPDFWDRDDTAAKMAAVSLLPFAWAYGASVRWKATHAKPYRARVPVVCIGNISAGGTGKTPLAIAVADAIVAHGRNPFFLTRGYGGRLQGPVVVAKTHTAADVGDEPLLLSRKAATVVSRDRALGAILAIERGADVIVMDDGHQNFSLAKDLSLVVVDGARGFRNGRVLPAGPLREPPQQGLARADVVVVMGDGNPALPGFAGPVLRAHLVPAAGSDWRGKRVFAFAGIGRPEKFFRTLMELGATLAGTAEYPDHHPYSPRDLSELKARADGSPLVTTEKDFVRIAPENRDGIGFLPVCTVIEPPGALDRLLDSLTQPR
jgi:tetraacyldisaccharide 4'-kinase